MFFWAEVSRPATGFDTVVLERSRVQKPLYGHFNLGKTKEGEQVLLKVALSPVSIEGAKANMAAELPGWDFEATKAAARQAWNDELSKVDATFSDSDTKTVFYTAMYHTMVAPSVFDDVDGQYRGSDDVVRKGNFRNYTTFSLWDTYRAQMPLMTLLHADRCNDITATFYHIYEQQGDLPVWHLMGNETDCMVGNPGLIAFADNIVKGFQAGLTKEQMITAMTNTATRPDRGQNFRMEYGYIPADLYAERLSRPQPLLPPFLGSGPAVHARPQGRRHLHRALRPDLLPPRDFRLYRGHRLAVHLARPAGRPGSPGPVRLA